MANLLKIKEILKEEGLTIRYLANELGMSEQGLQKLIRENSTKIETLESISKILKVSICVFFDNCEETSPKPSPSLPEDSFIYKMYQEKEKQVQQLTEELRAMERKVGNLEAELKHAETLGYRTAENVSIKKPSSQSKASVRSASVPSSE